MVQPLRPVCATPIRNNTSFGNKAPYSQADRSRSKKVSTTIKETAKYLGAQFTLGAAAMGIVDGGVNLFRLVRKNAPLIPLKQIGADAMSMGSWFAAFGAALLAVNAAMHAMNKRKEG